MRRLSFTHHRHNWTIALLFMLALCVALQGPLLRVAEAGVLGCRSDPIVVLSDGTILDVSVDIGTDVSQVTEIHYTVHGPRTTKLVIAISTPTLGFRGKETFTYINDAPDKTYITDAVVHTIPDEIPVTAHTIFSSATVGYNLALTLQYRPVKGFNGDVLRTELKR